jgi:ribosomal protein S18 acetylase RimI-like enzyme
VSATVTLRPPRGDEAAEVARLINAASRAEHGTDDVTEAEIRRWFTLPQINVERDIFVAEEQGRPVAYADVGDAGDTGEQLWIDIRLPPDASETAGEALLAAAERRAAERAEERNPGGATRVITGASSVNERLARLFEQAGFRLYRHSYRMVIDLEHVPSEPRFPDDIEVRTFTLGEERAVFEVVDEAFKDSWDHVPGVFEEWRHWALDREDFDPELWWLACDRDEIAGACLCRVHEAEPDLGWVMSLGVLRPWRRRGIARALLLTSFREFRRRGLARVGLGVDADSLTGANVLYESAGMRPERRYDLYEKERS